MNQNETVSLVKTPTCEKALGSCWCFTMNDGTTSAFAKARLVVQAFTQQEEIDYNQHFSLVIRYEFVRDI